MGPTADRTNNFPRWMPLLTDLEVEEEELVPLLHLAEVHVEVHRRLLRPHWGESPPAALRRHRFLRPVTLDSRHLESSQLAVHQRAGDYAPQS